ncbi:hypothetical protein [Moraxella catarrhalis]|uniref:hypothetical protein n=1 Tax=Moraxella catarrhalis TaxID=480 RepID=UPI0007E3DA6A|nr:hypothetical protein [Moraxella catarrhalis]
MWSNTQAQSKITSVLRKPGGYHEWMMVAKFSITPDELKRILSDKHTISSPVRQLDGGQFERVVNTGRIVGKASLNQGGGDTTYIKILTDVKGNLITVYPIQGGTQ